MKILIKQTTEVEKEIELPLFFKDSSKFWGFIDNMQITAFNMQDYYHVAKSPIYPNDLNECLTTREQINEAEFMNAYHNALESMAQFPLVF